MIYKSRPTDPRGEVERSVSLDLIVSKVVVYTMTRGPQGGDLKNVCYSFSEGLKALKR